MSYCYVVLYCEQKYQKYNILYINQLCETISNNNPIHWQTMAEIWYFYFSLKMCYKRRTLKILSYVFDIVGLKQWTKEYLIVSFIINKQVVILQ